MNKFLSFIIFLLYQGPESVVGITVGARCQVMPGARRGVVMFVGPIEQIKPGYWVRLLYFFQPCHIPLSPFLPFSLSSFLPSSLSYLIKYTSIQQYICLPSYRPAYICLYLVPCPLTSLLTRLFACQFSQKLVLISHFSILNPLTNMK